MKLFSAVALAVLAAAPTLASANAFTIDFEKNWEYGTDVNGYYSGGTATDGTTGPNAGVSFSNVSGLSNDPSFTYYSGAPSSFGTAYAHTFAAGDTAYMNIGSGIGNAISFYYSSPSAVAGAIKAYSGLNGTGTLLATFNLVANIATDYNAFTLATFSFGGIARSFDLTASANNVLFDNIASVPEPGSVLLMLAGATALAGLRRRRA